MNIHAFIAISIVLFFFAFYYIFKLKTQIKGKKLAIAIQDAFLQTKYKEAFVYKETLKQIQIEFQNKEEKLKQTIEEQKHEIEILTNDSDKNISSYIELLSDYNSETEKLNKQLDEAQRAYADLYSIYNVTKAELEELKQEENTNTRTCSNCEHSEECKEAHGKLYSKNGHCDEYKWNGKYPTLEE